MTLKVENSDREFVKKVHDSNFIFSELRLSFIDENLCRTVAKNIGKAIRVFCINSERSVVHDGNSSQVIGEALKQNLTAIVSL